MFHVTILIVSENPRVETIRVDENDIFDLDFDKASKKPEDIRLVASDGNTEKHIDIKLSYKSGYLIVHTDKPIYTPRQHGTEVQFHRFNIYSLKRLNVLT